MEMLDLYDFPAKIKLQELTQDSKDDPWNPHKKIKESIWKTQGSNKSSVTCTTCQCTEYMTLNVQCLLAPTTLYDIL